MRKQKWIRKGLAVLEFNEAVFLDENGNPVTGS